MKPVRWGIIGVARHFIRGVLIPMQHSEFVELHGIASRDPAKARAAAEKYGIPRYYQSYDDLLRDPTIEAVYIPLPNHMHLEWIRKSAEAGKHIVCEKPLTMNAAEAAEAADYAERCGVLLMEAFMYRFHPQWRRAHELVMSGHIGDVRAVQTFFSYDNTDPENIRNRLDTGGGAILDIGCYAVSVSRFMFDSEPKRIVSMANRDPRFKTDILCSALLDFGDGHAVFTVGTQTFPFQTVDVIGSAGRIHIDIPFNIYPDVPVVVTVTTSIGTRELSAGPADHYRIQFEHFSEAIRENRPSPIPSTDAVKNMRVLDAFFRSERSGEWETIET